MAVLASYRLHTMHSRLSLSSIPLKDDWTPLVAQTPPTVHETRVPSLGQEDPLEEGMATHSRILAWRVPWTEEPCGLQGAAESEVT